MIRKYHLDFNIIIYTSFKLYKLYNISINRNKIRHNSYTGFVERVTRRVYHVERELLALPQHLSSPLVCNAVRFARLLFSCVMFSTSLFVLFLFANVLSFLRFTLSDYPFGIFNFILYKYKSI